MAYYGPVQPNVHEATFRKYGVQVPADFYPNMSSVANPSDYGKMTPNDYNFSSQSSQSSEKKTSGGGGSGFSANDFAASLGYGSTGAAKAALGVSSLEDYAKTAKKQISSGWDSYIQSLEDQLGGLDSQATNQRNIVNNQLAQSAGDLDLQLSQGQAALSQNRADAETNQVKNLRDISSNVKNALMAGNVYLGARGAGDSSAANQYSYALGKQATKQRSDVMSNTAGILNQINMKESDLKNIYDNETNKLNQRKEVEMASIAQWFSNAQNQIKQLMAEGKLNKSQDLANLSRDLLDQAIQRTNQIEQQAMQRRQMLDQWAMGVSSEINQLRNNMQATYQFTPQYPQAGPLASGINLSGGNTGGTAYGGGFSNEEENNNIFRMS
jgi:hypothetical protein